MIDVNYNEYKETIAQNMKLVVENHDLKEKIERLKERLDIAQTAYLSVNEKNDKAIEYIEENCTEHGEGKWAYRTINADNTLNILKGVDKE